MERCSRRCSRWPPHPRDLSARVTVGERRLYELLRAGLPDRFTAWYEPLVCQRHPDFALLGPDFGLRVLEVKGWYAGQVARATDHEVELHRLEGGRRRSRRTSTRGSRPGSTASLRWTS